MVNMKFYRYVNYGENIILLRFKIIKETPKGYWIQNIIKYLIGDYPDGSKPHWIRKEAERRFAYPNKEDALNNFLCRKRSEMEHLQRRMNYVESCMHQYHNIKSKLYWKEEKILKDFLIS